jgi:dihydropteroate synthase
VDAIRIGVRIFAGPGPFFMGIVNATPDSFSDGGRYLARDAAVAQAERLAEDGADIVDLGGESTRPGSPTVPVDEEIARVVPVIAALRSRGLNVPISIDTRKAAVARAALDAGADLVNDVSALSDPALAALVAERAVPVVLMHMRGSPADMQSHAVYGDVVADVALELAQALSRAEAAGVRREQVILDPGIGFAKTAEHNLALLGAIPRLRAVGRPLLVGPSRKAFIGAITGAAVSERLPGTLAAVTAAVLAGAEFVRVHDVAPARQAGLIAAAIRAASRSDGAAPACM